MKYYTFYRETNNFKDILNDPNIKKSIDQVITWYQYLTIGMHDAGKSDQNSSYIALKYGDEMKDGVIKDFSPLPGIDYIPKKDPKQFKTTD